MEQVVMHGSSASNGQHVPAVLVIEQDEETRRRIADGLRSRDYRAIEAANGATGLRLLEESQSVSVIVLDLVLPRLSGWDFRRRQLRTRYASVPTIVISPQPLHPNDLDVLGAAQVVEKPLDIEHLLDTVGRLSTPVATPAPLFWSRPGEVACANHAPVVGSTRWTEEKWCVTSELGQRQVRYQCQYCAEDGSPIARSSRGTHERMVSRPRSPAGRETYESVIGRTAMVQKRYVRPTISPNCSSG